MWHFLTGLGLGLNERDIHRIQRRADKDKTGTISWGEFGPVIADLLKDSFSAEHLETAAQSPWVNLEDPETGARYFYNRQTGESEWVTGEVEQSARVGTPFAGHGAGGLSIGRDPPPTLTEYLRRLFDEHDADGSGSIDSHEFWHVFTGLGLGLTDGDVRRLEEKADRDRSGTVSWEVEAGGRSGGRRALFPGRPNATARPPVLPHAAAGVSARRGAAAGRHF